MASVSILEREAEGSDENLWFETPTMDEWAKIIYEWARSKGFYEDREFDTQGIPNPCYASEKIALIGSEASEILEARRDDDVDEEELECADVIIRVLDYAHWRGFSMDDAVARKMAKNQGRPYKHGRKF